MDYSAMITAIIAGLVIGIPSFVISVASIRITRKKGDADVVASLNKTVKNLVDGQAEMIEDITALQKKIKENQKMLDEYVKGSDVLYSQAKRNNLTPDWIPPHILNPASFESARWD